MRKIKSSYNYGRTGKHGLKRRSKNNTNGAFGKPRKKSMQTIWRFSTGHLSKRDYKNGQERKMPLVGIQRRKQEMILLY